eukprot:jgi/Psemu1/305214/fgenesh1_kg.186_\
MCCVLLDRFAPTKVDRAVPFLAVPCRSVPCSTAQYSTAQYSTARRGPMEETTTPSQPKYEYKFPCLALPCLALLAAQ